MKIQRRNRFHAEVSTASLNDIMFFLLLFFLIISTVANPNVIKLMLPNVKKSDKPVNKKSISLSVTKEKTYFIDKTEIPKENLEAELQKRKSAIASRGTTEDERAGKDITVILRADQTLTVQDLVDVLALGTKLELKIVLAANLLKE